MAKVTINGEMFDFDASKRPMLEALTIEDKLKMRFADWETELQAGSVKALVGFVWMVWHRDGRDVSIEDILDGTAEVNLTGVNIEDDGADPTSPPPDPSPTTPANTRVRSPKPSASDPGK